MTSLSRHPSTRWSGSKTVAAGFSLIELVVSITLLAVLLLILEKMTDSVMHSWRDGQERTDGFQSARTALEVMSRELAPAVVDTRMQFVVAPASVLEERGAVNVVPATPVILWMAPLGTAGDLRCVGYYLTQDPVRRFYRLKRLSIAAFDSGRESLHLFFPDRFPAIRPARKELRSSPHRRQMVSPRSGDGATFDDENPENKIVSSAADGVIAFWVQCRDVLGNSVTLLSNADRHPKSELLYNSAAYFQVATTTPFEDGRSLVYLSETLQSMKANRVPASIDLTIVTLDNTVLNRGVTIPPQPNLLDSSGALDLDASVREFESELRRNHIYTARTFTTRAKLVNGG